MTKSRQGQQIQPCSYVRSRSFPLLSVVSRPLWCSCSHKTLFLQIRTLFPNTKPPPLSAWRTQGALEGHCYGNPSSELQLATFCAVRTFHEMSSRRTCWETLACVSSVSLPVWLGKHSALIDCESHIDCGAELGHQRFVKLAAARTRHCDNTGVMEGGTCESVVGYYPHSFLKDSCTVEDCN